MFAFGGTEPPLDVAGSLCFFASIEWSVGPSFSVGNELLEVSLLCLIPSSLWWDFRTLFCLW